MKINKVKGTYDIYGIDSLRWQKLEDTVRKLYKLYGYGEIRTPIMEYSPVFHRDSEKSDMVMKETYDFKDRAGRDVSLRPETTAGVVRAYIENKLYAHPNLAKFYYIGPNFRYERPQKGRYRQFMQFGVEVLGGDDPLIDVEVIQLAYQTIKTLGLKGVKVCINSLGDSKSRSDYEQALKEHFKDTSTLCSDCKERYERNVLRILDCKIDQNNPLVLSAPLINDYLTEESKKRNEFIIKMLNELKIPFDYDPKLVRGLDYYSHIVFEIKADIEGFGAQNVLGGGGRYQGLVEELGGPKIGGVGFAFGMERLLYAIEAEGIPFIEEEKPLCYILTTDQKEVGPAMKILSDLREDGFIAEMNLVYQPLKNQIKRAVSSGAKYFLFIGEEEIKQNVVSVKNSVTQEQEVVPLKILSKYLKENLADE